MLMKIGRGVAHKDAVRLFEDIATGKYEAFTSVFVVKELEEAREEKRNKMLNLIPEYGVTMLADSSEVARIADMYVTEGVIPDRYRMDGLHIAIATVNELDMIISMNFEHIVKRKTIRMTEHINRMNGYNAVEIHSPAEVVEYEEGD